MMFRLNVPTRRGVVLNGVLFREKQANPRKRRRRSRRKSAAKVSEKSQAQKQPQYHDRRPE